MQLWQKFLITLASVCPLNPLYPVIPEHVDQKTRATLTCIIDWYIRNNLDNFSNDANSVWGVDKRFINLKEYIENLNSLHGDVGEAAEYYETDFTDLVRKGPVFDFFFMPSNYKCVTSKGLYGRINLSYKLKLPERLEFKQVVNILRKGCVFKIPDDLYKSVVESQTPHKTNNEVIAIFSIVVVWLSIILYAIRVNTLENASFNVKLFEEFKSLIMLLLPFLLLTISKETLSAVFTTQLALLLFHVLRNRKHFNIPATYEEFRRRQSLSKSFTFEFITIVRVLLFICVNICIIAVDFITFSPLLAKSKYEGLTLMDVGEGCYIFSASIISPIRKRRKFKNASKSTILKKIFVKSFVAILLGFTRLFITKAVRYPVPITEYGHHGNFFFVLGVVSFISEVMLELLPPKASALFALLYAVGYEFFLKRFDIHNLIRNNNRETFALKNLESLLNTAGLVSLYMTGYLIGHILLYLDNKHSGHPPPSTPLSEEPALNPNNRAREVIPAGEEGGNLGSHSKVWFMVTVVFFSGLLYWLLDFYDLESWRVLANLRYNLFIVFTSSLLVLFSLLFVIYFKSYKTTSIIEVLNNNSLHTFIYCNVITGLINMFIQTKLMPIYINFVILFFYSVSFVLFAHYIK